MASRTFTTIPVAVAYYRLHHVPLFAVLLWVFLRHPPRFRTVLRVLMVMAISIAVAAAWDRSSRRRRSRTEPRPTN